MFSNKKSLSLCFLTLCLALFAYNPVSAGDDDGITQAPVLTSPTNNTLDYDDVMQIAYTLAEQALNNSVTLYFIGDTVITISMANDMSVDFDMNLSSITSSSVLITSSTEESIPPGIYDVTISYQDFIGNPVASSTATNVGIALAPELSLTNTLESYSSFDGLPITYSIPTTPVSDSVTITILNEDDSTVITLPNTSGFDLTDTLSIDGLLDDGTYTLTLSYEPAEGSAFTATLTDVVVATPTINTTDVLSEDASTTVDVTVSLVHPSTQAITVDYSTVDDTALAGVDYTATTGTLTWEAGNTDDKTITIPLTTTTSSDGKTFQVLLSNADGAYISQDTSQISLTHSLDTSGDDDSTNTESSSGCQLQQHASSLSFSMQSLLTFVMMLVVAFRLFKSKSLI